MADFVDCDFNETEPANESCDIFENDEPPAKKKRGENVKYKFVEEVESSDDLKQKANVAGVTKINTQIIIIQAFLNAGIKKLPKSKQINNYI
uniref:Uncharacterized protein n=1 Tax=Panagrolaimus davidi TaxID=227884 RepID=A0A914PYR5_9BILA